MPSEAPSTVSVSLSESVSLVSTETVTAESSLVVAVSSVATGAWSVTEMLTVVSAPGPSESVG